MAIVKIVGGKYINPDAVENTICYITGNRNNRQDKVYSVGGLGVDYSKYENAIKQFQATKLVWNKEDKRQVVHIVVSFGDTRERLLKPVDIERLAYPIGALLSKGEYQVMWSIHKNTDNLHIHYIINSVSYRTGKKYRLEPDERFLINQRVNVMVAPMIYSPVEIMNYYQNAY